ncbi:MAG: hypothetical protein CVV07_11755 [Gammaproteobacteria bacterium HGW-Gammaproteobacteria-11]|nr:MAG: hypothetical protein CVV07_11755 [Gammaproteobacteria bacterium HGW-Gammaproteobacteria-11]
MGDIKQSGLKHFIQPDMHAKMPAIHSYCAILQVSCLFLQLSYPSHNDCLILYILQQHHGRISHVY